MKILHGADFHIDQLRHTRFNPKTGKQTALESNQACVEAVINHALEQNVDALIVAGDTFDTGRPKPEHIAWMADQFKRLTNEGIAVIAEDGNHGRHGVGLQERGPSALLAASGVIVYDTIGIQEVSTKSGTLHVLTVPWPERARLLEAAGVNGQLDGMKPRELDNLLSGLVAGHIEDAVEALGDTPDFFIASSHMTVTEPALARGSEVIINNRGLFEEVMLPIDLFEPLGIQYLALGHIHKGQDLGIGAYAGSINRLTFGEETDDKGVRLVDLSNPSERTLLRTPARAMVNLRLDENPEPDVESLEPGTLVKVHLAQGDRQVPEVIQKALKRAGAITVSTKPKPPQADPTSREMLSRSLTLNEAFDGWATLRGYDDELKARLDAKVAMLATGCNH